MNKLPHVKYIDYYLEYMKFDHNEHIHALNYFVSFFVELVTKCKHCIDLTATFLNGTEWTVFCYNFSSSFSDDIMLCWLNELVWTATH